MSLNYIKESVTHVLDKLPEHVQLVAAAKTRSFEEVDQAIEAGVKILGYNYVQEAERMYQQVGDRVKWHMIGHLQKNKVKKVVRFAQMIESVDSAALAMAIDTSCAQLDKIMPVLIEVNSGREPAKNGVMPQDTEALIQEICSLKHVKVQGLMTMGPLGGEPEDSRPYFRETKKLFDYLAKCQIPNTEMKYLSMGMSDSYLIAIEEGANIVRIGTLLFGSRER